MTDILMGDMLVIMPSRGRPEKAIHAIAEGMTFSTAHTHYWIGVDEDDPKLSEYEAMLMHRLVHMHERVFIAVGPRLNLVQWTNFAAKAFAKNYRYLASFGDDHVPESLGWDSSLIQAIEGSSGGIGMAYPEDLRRNDIPEAVVMSSSIVSALGWMMEPSLQHFYVDNVWADLGNGANCLQFCPHVTVRHNHYQANPQVQRDNTYAEAESHGGDDEMAYQRWRTTRMDQDIQTIKSLRGES